MQRHPFVALFQRTKDRAESGKQLLKKMRTLIKKILQPFVSKAHAFYLRKPRRYSYKAISVWVAPGVFPPFLTLSTKLLLEFTEMLALKGKTFLELGCGCGIISILAAKKEAKVTATDINENALAWLRRNAVDNGVSIEIIPSDLFENLHEKAFDFVVINPPYYAKNPNSIAEKAWFCGENFDYFENLFAQLPDFITAENQTFMILSEDCAIETIRAIAAKSDIGFELVSERKVAAEKNYIFRLRKL